MKIIENYEVCRTGKLHQYYTLYIHKTINNHSFFLESYNFIQNLSKNENDAWNKAAEIHDDHKKTMINSWGMDSYFSQVDMFDSPKREYCDLKAFGYSWKKTEKGFITEPSQDFWNVWREFKSILKDAGFSVFKNDDNIFILFFRNTTQENMINAFNLLDNKKASQITQGNFIGKISDKIKSLPVTVLSSFVGNGFYGPYQMITMKNENGDRLRCKYSGKKVIENGANILINATITEHKIFDGFNTTSNIFLNP